MADERTRLLEAALVECFDIAIPQAMPWMNSSEEKAEYAAKTLPWHLRALIRLGELDPAKLSIAAHLMLEVAPLLLDVFDKVPYSIDQAGAPLHAYLQDHQAQLRALLPDDSASIPVCPPDFSTEPNKDTPNA